MVFFGQSVVNHVLRMCLSFVRSFVRFESSVNGSWLGFHFSIYHLNYDLWHRFLIFPLYLTFYYFLLTISSKYTHPSQSRFPTGSPNIVGWNSGLCFDGWGPLISLYRRNCMGHLPHSIRSTTVYTLTGTSDSSFAFRKNGLHPYHKTLRISRSYHFCKKSLVLFRPSFCKKSLVLEPSSPIMRDLWSKWRTRLM